jgi:hypothetical protein
MITNLQRQLYVIAVGTHTRRLAPPNGDKLILHEGPVLRVEGRERFIHQEDFRAHSQSSRDRHALSHASRQLARLASSDATFGCNPSPHTQTSPSMAITVPGAPLVCGSCFISTMPAFSPIQNRARSIIPGCSAVTMVASSSQPGGCAGGLRRKKATTAAGRAKGSITDWNKSDRWRIYIFARTPREEARMTPGPDEHRPWSISPAQCRAARELANMSITKLAAAAVLPAVVIYDFERGFRKLKPEDLAAIKGALERAGVEFIERGVRERDGP